MNSMGNIKEETLEEDDDESDEQINKFIPEVIIKKEHKNHKVIVKEANFKSEFEEEEDDFDPFSCEVRPKVKKRKTASSKPKTKFKLEESIVKDGNFDPIKNEIELHVNKDTLSASSSAERFISSDSDYDADDFFDAGLKFPLQGNDEKQKLQEESVNEDSDDENLSLVKKKTLGSKKKITTKIASKTKGKKIDENFVKPIKKRVYKAESEDEADRGHSDQEPEKCENNLKRSLKGPQITEDLRYSCLHENCDNVVFDTAFGCVDHMEEKHGKTLSVVRIRNFIPWEREPGAIVSIHPKKLHDLIMCDNCKKQYSSREGLKRHKLAGKCDSVKENYICKICQKDLKRSDLRILHMKLVHPEEKAESVLKCLICEDMHFENKEAITEHYSSVHLNNFPCKYCTKLYSSAICLLEHIRSQHENFGLICDICGKVTRCVRELKNHKEIHQTELTIKCTECDLMFPTETKMQKHFTNVHNPGHFECETCQKVYVTEKKLQRHRYLKHSEKNYRCHLCGKGFLANGEFNNHLLWHEGKWKPKKKIWKPQTEKNHGCTICDFRTARAYSLKCHIKRIHMGEKWSVKKDHYICEICNKEFSEKRFYRKHLSRKTVHMVHKCDKCGIDVLGLDGFREHKKTHSKKAVVQESFHIIDGRPLM